MNKRIPVEVVHATSNFADAKCIESIDGNSADAWFSDIFSEWPQTLIVRVNGGIPAKVSQLQLMAHEVCIPQRVEVLAGNFPEGDFERHYDKFKRMGHFHFTDNTESRLQAREVKTVTLNVKCNMIMLKFFSCHMNSRNLFNQVGIVGLTVLGDWVKDILADFGYEDSEKTGESGGVSESRVPSSPQNGASSARKHIFLSFDERRQSEQSQSVHSQNPNLTDDDRRNYSDLVSSPGQSPTSKTDIDFERIASQRTDGISFDMQFDRTTALEIRKCRAAKLYWAKLNDFKKAAALKSAENKLRELGIKISNLELSKTTAITAEDFKLAEKISMKIVDMRIAAMGDLDDSYKGLIAEYKGLIIDDDEEEVEEEGGGEGSKK